MTVSEFYEYCTKNDWQDKDIAIRVIERGNYNSDSITFEKYVWDTDLDVDLNEQDEVCLS